MADRFWRATVKFSLAAAMIPLAWSIVAHAAPPAPRAFAIQDDRPALAFSQYLIDKGQVEATAQEDAKFGFTNRGAQPVTLTKLSASCGCLQPVVLLGDQHYRPDQEDRMSLTIPPGAHGVILLRIQMANQEPGDHDYTVTAEFDDGRLRRRELGFRLIIPDRGVFVRPASMMLYPRDGLMPTDQEIVVNDRYNGALRIEGVSCTSDLFEFEVLEPRTDPNGYRQIPIKMRMVRPAAPGRQTHVVQIFTNDPRYAQLRAVVRVENNSKPAPQVTQEPSGDLQ